MTVERGLQGMQGGARLLVSREQIGEHSKRLGLRIRRRRMLIGGISRSRSAGDEIVPIVGLRVVGRSGNRSGGEPVGWVRGRGGNGCAGELVGRGEVAACDSLSGFRQQLPRRFAFDRGADRRRRAAQGLGQAYGVARHVLACEGLGLGGAGGAAKRIRRAASERRA
jgi:hypothetical protein